MRRLVRIAVAFLGVAAVAGCGDETAPGARGEGGQPTPELSEVPPADGGTCARGGDGLVLLVSAHANGPGPGLPDQVVRLVADVARSSPVDGSGPAVTVVELTAPSTASPAVSAPFSSEAANGPAVDADRQAAFDAWLQAVPRLRASSGEVDVLGGLATAARYTRTGAIVLVAPALQTVDPLDFTRPPGLLGADPDEVVSYLRSQNALPPLTGRTVLLSGVGDTTPPQQPLDDRNRRHLTEIWSAIATAAGACVEVLDRPRTGPPLDGVPPVDVVPVPAAVTSPTDGCGGVVLDQATVAFVRDSPDFLAEDEAARVVEPIAACLRADRTQRVLLTGTTACAGLAPDREELSRQRAERVGALLTRLGATADQIRTRGVGSEFDGYVPDRGATGLLPGPAAANRSVRITRDTAGPDPTPAARKCYS